MERFKRVVVVAAVLFGVAAAAWAVGQGRIYGFVKDQTGETIPGAKIVVTCPDLPTFKLELVTNAQGKYTLALVDATKSYHYHIEKPGFASLDQDVKIAIGSNTEQDFMLVTEQVARAAQEAAAPQPVADPAVEAYNSGVQLLNAGDRAGAIAKFTAATEANPELGTAWGALATVLLQEKKPKEAAAAAEKAAALDPGDTRALRVQVDAYRALGDTAKGKAAAAALAALDPSAGALDLYNQGVDLYNAGKTDQAVKAFEQALAADASNAKIHYMLGLCHVAGNPAKAKEHFQKFLAMAPADPDAATAKEMLTYL